jgi:hypothetical protein
MPILVLVFLSLAASQPQQPPAMTAEQIVKKALDARGGLARIKAVKSQRVSGTISFGSGFDGPFTVELKRPLKMHMEFQVQGQTVVRVFDGVGAGWMVNPFAENKDPVPLSGDDLQNISDESDFDGPLVDAESKGTRIEYLGKDEVEGKPAEKLKVTIKSGQVRTYYFDASSFLLLKWAGVRKAAGQEIAVESLLSDYRDVGGLKFAFKIDNNSPADGQSQKITLSNVELDVPLDDSRFVKPATAHPASQ